MSFRYLDKNKKKSFSSLENLIEKIGISDKDNHYEKLEKSFYVYQVKNGCLLGLLKCLSFQQRIAFILNILYDIPVNEISIILNKSENSTRILIHRARKNIRNFLCKNCSIYDEKNKCKCENLINFSIKQNWINKYDSKITPEIIETELKKTKDEVLLFKSIPNINVDLKSCLEKIINNSQIQIFSNKKVK
jgi:RNA polymerase sigma-70 factor (ECF subfamily)